MAKQALQRTEGTEIVNVRRRQDRATETRRKIVEAGATEFAVSGFDGATTRSIAARAEVPHGLVIYHFETKLGVWAAVTEDALIYFREQFAKTKKKFAGLDDVTQLRELFRVSIRNWAKRPELTWVLSHEGEEAARMASLVTEIIGPDIDLTIDLIGKVQKLGKYVEGDPAHLHYLFVGASCHVFSMPGFIERSTGQSPFTRRFLERHTELCLNLFFRDSKSKFAARRSPR